MESENNREAFIPYRRTDIIHLCMTDGRLDAETRVAFQGLCQALMAYYHFQFHQDLESLKDNYVVFNPDADAQPLYEPTLNTLQEMETTVVRGLEGILQRANYIRMSDEMLQQALTQRSMINLKTDIDFDDFEQFLCYYRGDIDQTATVPKFFFWRTEKTVDILERLVILIKFKGKGYFRAKSKREKRRLNTLKFTPGKMYVYFYKNIPKLDLDLLFPNIKTSMIWRDRLLLVVPAIATAIPVIWKALPNLFLLVAAVLLAFDLYPPDQPLDVDAAQARDVMPIMLATSTLVIALGGFVVRQYSQFKSKKIKFQKEVADTLFFKSLATNASAFQMLVDLAEEEECKEIILVYYHLLTSTEPLTPTQLDLKIEHWMAAKTGAQINFDIQGPLKNLERLRGFLPAAKTEKALLEYDQQGHCQVLSIQDARIVLNTIWDQVLP